LYLKKKKEKRKKKKEKRKKKKTIVQIFPSILDSLSYILYMGITSIRS
jgi:DNA topoisomerase VI subunit B